MNSTFSNRELTLIDREGERIKELLTKLVNSFPIHARTITGMSAWLNASKTTCQRIVESINTTSGSETIVALPGPSGFRKFLELANQKQLPRSVLSSNDDAIRIFESLIGSYSTSHTALKEALKDGKSPSKSEEELEFDSRKKLYEASEAFLNESIEVNFSLFLHKENESNARYLQQYVLTSYRGCRFGENSRPLAFVAIPSLEELEIDRTEVLSVNDKVEKTPVFSFVREFTSENVIISPDSTAYSSGRLIMTNYLDKENLSDVAILKNYERDLLNPAYGGIYAGLTGVEIRNPTKRLYYICFMEKSLAIKSLVSSKVLSISPGFEASKRDPFWFDRLYTQADITILQPNVNYDSKLGLEGANEVVQAFFSLTNNNTNDYLGYLMKVDYPIWSSVYVMQFPVSVENLD